MTIVYTPPAINRTELKPWVNNRLNIAWLLQRLPVFVLSIESAAGVYKYLKLTNTDEIISWIGSIGFDAVFIGMIALSDQVRHIEVKQDTQPRVDWLFWLINVGALVSAFLFGVLAHSAGKYTSVTPEAVTRAFVFPFLSFLYTLFFDRQVRIIKEQIAADESKRKAFLAEYPLVCKHCDRRFRAEDIKRLNGHAAQCVARTASGSSNSAATHEQVISSDIPNTAD